MNEGLSVPLALVHNTTNNPPDRCWNQSVEGNSSSVKGNTTLQVPKGLPVVYSPPNDKLLTDRTPGGTKARRPPRTPPLAPHTPSPLTPTPPTHPKRIFKYRGKVPRPLGGKASPRKPGEASRWSQSTFGGGHYLNGVSGNCFFPGPSTALARHTASRGPLRSCTPPHTPLPAYLPSQHLTREF